MGLVVLAGSGGLDHPPHGDAEDDRPGDEEGGGDDVEDGRPQDVIAQDREEAADAVELGPAGRPVDDGAHGMLHPGVGGEDEEGGDIRAQGDHPHAQVVQLGGQAVPTEDPQAEEGRFHEEGEEGLEGQRRAEDVADVAGVLGPVHAELELLHDAGGHAEGEVDQQDLAEERRGDAPLLVAGAQVGGLHERHERGQPDRERNEDEVVDGRDAELPSSQIEGVQRHRCEHHQRHLSG